MNSSRTRNHAFRQLLCFALCLAIGGVLAGCIRLTSEIEKRPPVQGTDRFTVGPNLLHARTGAQAYPTAGGGALIRGDWYSSETRQIVEIHDPRTKSFRTASGSESTPSKNEDGTWSWYGETLSAGLTPAQLLDLTMMERKPPATNSYAKRVLLPGNLILSVGGVIHQKYAVIGYSPTAQIVDASKKAITWSGSMLQPRAHCTATLLNNGKVLIAGGQQFKPKIGSIPLDSTEIFDPKTRTFSQGPKLTRTRYDHQAVSLRDGRVLLLSGASPGSKESPKCSDVYDPKSNTIKATGPQVFAADGQATVLLPSGNVLTCGSYVGSYNAQIYRADKNDFIDAGPMIEHRARQCAVVLGDGRVLIAGGQHVAGVSDETGSLNTTEFFKE